jgi:trimeric autotransporter adhesin
MQFVAASTTQQARSSQQGSIAQSTQASTTGTAATATSTAPSDPTNVLGITPSSPNTQLYPSQTVQHAASNTSTVRRATQMQDEPTSSPNTTISTSQTSQGTGADSSITSSATPYQQQISTSNQAAAPAASDDSTTPDSNSLGSQPGVSFTGSAISFSDATPSAAATNDPTVSAQAPADPTTAAATSTFAVPQTGSTSSETSAVVDTWTKKRAQTQAPVASLPSSANSEKSGKSQAVPSATNWAVSPSQTTANTVAVSAADPSVRQQQVPAANASVKTKSDVSSTAPTPTPTPHPVAVSNIPTAGSSKTQVATTPTSVSASPLSDAVWSIPTPAGNSTTLTSLKQSAPNLGTEDSAAPTLPDKTTTDSSTSSDQSANSGSDDNSRPTVSQTIVSSISSELFAPVSVASSASAKQDSPVSANGGTSSSHSDTATDNQLPSAVVMHRAAEAAELSAGLQAWNGGDNAQTRMVQSARLAGNLGSSEMNVSLRAEGLGGVEVRTHVAGDTVGASINVERHDAHAMLSNDLGSLHQALNDRQLRVGDVKVFQGAFGSDATAADNHTSQRREMAPQQQQSTNWTSSSSTSFASATATADRSDANIFFDSNGRLSVRA